VISDDHGSSRSSFRIRLAGRRYYFWVLEWTQSENGPGELKGIGLRGVAEFVPRSAHVGHALRGALFSMGARKKLSQSIELKLNRLSFFLCPQTPAYEERAFCEAKARPFILIPGGYGGHSERHQWAAGPLVSSERSPPSRTKLPRSERPSRAERRGNHRVRLQFDRVEITACAFNSTA